MKYFAIKLVQTNGEDPPAEVIASVKARDLPEAIAIAMGRYPGTMAVDGELHAVVPSPDDEAPASD